MDGQLARKLPAREVVRMAMKPGPTLPRREMLERPLHQKAALLTEIHQMARRGEIGATYAIQETARGWRVEVVRIREKGRSWRRPAAIVAGCVLALVGIGWLVVWTITTLVAALAAALPTLAVLMVCLLALLAAGGTTVVSVIQNVTVKR